MRPLKIELPGFRGGEILCFEHLNSTQTFLKDNSSQLPIDTTVMALSQGDGHGRRGRSWSQIPRKDLAFSSSFEISSESSVIFLTQYFAYGLRESIEEYCGITLELKWPNDLMYGDAKVGGLILNEMRSKRPDKRLFALGLGLNVLSLEGERAHLDRKTKSLLEIEQSIQADTRKTVIQDLISDTSETLTIFLSKILQPLSSVIYLVEKPHPSTLKHVLSQFKLTEGAQIQWIAEGGQEDQGVLLGIEEEGALVVRPQGQTLLKILRNLVEINY